MAPSNFGLETILHSNSLRTLAILTVRNEARYLIEWVAYHRSIGFDNIIVTSNDNDDGSDALLAALDRHGFIVHIDNSAMIPEFDRPRGLQHRAYWLATGHPLFLEHDWCSFIDADEFIVLKKHADIKSFLADHDDKSAIAINWRNFGSSGLKEYEDKPVIERFTWASDTAFSQNGVTKVIFRPRDIERVAFGTGPHYVQLSANVKPYCYSNGTLFKSYKDASNIHLDEIQLNHYVIKSLGEFISRGSRGDVASTPKYDKDYFDFNDKNDEQDFSIAYFTPGMKRIAALLRAVPDIAAAERSALATYASSHGLS